MLVHGRLEPGLLYELNVEIHLNAYTKAGSVRRVDLTNRIKFLEDCVREALGIDDRQIFRVIMNKHHSDVQRTVVTLDLLRA
jgi:Holliday junction resolvase RusA-like endonuclease